MTSKRAPWDHGDKSSKERGYGREHRRLREQLLRAEPLCRLCRQKNPPRITPATIADHILSIAKGGAVHDIDNMQPVCKPCHDRKSLIEQGKRPRPTIAPDGWPVDD